MKILVTGGAGFIGSAVAEQLAKRGDSVVAVDVINNYYDPRLKYARLRRMGFAVGDDLKFNTPITSASLPNLKFQRLDIADKASLDALMLAERFEVVVNLAAQAGVRYSIENPYAYLHSNIEGFLNILEGCRHSGVRHLVYASSSSIYGLNSKVPYCESDKTDSPVSLYAASKKSNELMAHAYSKLYGFATTGLRYFTVYGPWGRPDMSPFLFTDAILHERPIKVFNYGDMYRDFTFIDDIVDGTIGIVDSEPEPDTNGVLHHVYNIGGANSVKLTDFIGEIERACGKTAEKEFLPMQPGDVYQTAASTQALEAATGRVPKVRLPEGVDAFVEWYRSDLNPLK